MLKFFRRIRRKLIDEGNLKKYLIYAIGEILLVMVGILMALQVNTWNEKQKELRSEEKILTNLMTEIESCKRSLEFNLREKRKILEVDKYLLKYTGLQANWDSKQSFDSLLFVVAISGWQFQPEDGVLTDLLTSGKIDLISNDSLRYLISSLPKNYSTLAELDDTYISDLRNYYLPFLSKKYPSRSFMRKGKALSLDFSLGASNFDAQPENLLNSQEFESILSFQSTWTKFQVNYYNLVSKKYSNIISLIEKEIK